MGIMISGKKEISSPAEAAARAARVERRPLKQPVSGNAPDEKRHFRAHKDAA
jgi:hypothetical protein